jgi:hypothetical protein
MGLFSTSSPFDSDVGKFLRVFSLRHQQIIVKFQDFGLEKL